MKTQVRRINICPRCKTRGVSVEIKACIAIDDGFPAYPAVEEFFAQCGICTQGIILQAISSNSLAGQRSKMVSIVGILPETGIDIPEHLPDNVTLYLKQGVDSTDQKNWDAAGVMFRKALEAALRELFPNNAENPLIKQIKTAAEEQKLTSDMAAWADQIRLSGNEAAHGQFTKKDAEQLQEFTKLVMIYLFTLPEKMKQAKEKNSTLNTPRKNVGPNTSKVS